MRLSQKITKLEKTEVSLGRVFFVKQCLDKNQNEMKHREYIEDCPASLVSTNAI